jgi:predicted nucleic acid-binding protein
MGLILDASVLITAERNGDSIAKILDRIFLLTGNQETAISSIALVEMAHGIFRANTPERRERRQVFIDELLADVPVYPFTRPIAMLAGRIDAEQQMKGIKIPFQDLLIGATALDLGYAVVTGNARHFKIIPCLTVIGL